LIAWAEFEFRGNRPAADGSTERQHVESGKAQWAKIPAALRRPDRRAESPITAPKPADAPPAFPELLTYLWQWFQELTLGIAPTGFGPAVITWEALRSWREVMGIDLEAWEARALVFLGMLRASIAAESSKTTDKPPPPRPRPAGIGGRRFDLGGAVG
jgi:hypothetical protein